MNTLKIVCLPSKYLESSEYQAIENIHFVNGYFEIIQAEVLQSMKHTSTVFLPLKTASSMYILPRTVKIRSPSGNFVYKGFDL